MTTLVAPGLWQSTLARLSPLFFAGAGQSLRRRRQTPAIGSEVIDRLGPLQIRLASTTRDIRLAQRLRYQVFYEEMSASPGLWTSITSCDVDEYDTLCDHLLVEDRSTSRQARPLHSDVIGTYRLLKRSATRSKGFYSENEFDLGDLLTRHPTLNILELGRSCVLPQYRNKRTIELLWSGIWAYICAHRCELLIGCASFEETDLDKLALPLSFLHHFAPAPPEFEVSALPGRYVEMNCIAKDKIDAKAALRQLPPLMKGYLRLGATVGKGAVVDPDFGTTDVFMILPVASIKDRYIQYFASAQ